MTQPKPRLVQEATIQLRTGERIRVLIQFFTSKRGQDILTAWGEDCNRYFCRFGEEPKPWIEADMIRYPIDPLTVERFRRKWEHIKRTET